VSALNPAGESANSLPAKRPRRALWKPDGLGGEFPAHPEVIRRAMRLDGNLSTRLVNGRIPGAWPVVFRWTWQRSNHVFPKIVLNAANSSSDYPRGYQVNVSNDGV